MISRNTHSQEGVFKVAGRIYGSLDRPRASAVRDHKQSVEADIKNMLENLSARLQPLGLRQSSLVRRWTSSCSFSRHHSPSKSFSKKVWCWYHKRYASKLPNTYLIANVPLVLKKKLILPPFFRLQTVLTLIHLEGN